MCAIEFCPEVVKFTEVNNVDGVLNDAVVPSAGVVVIGVNTPVCVVEFGPKVVKLPAVINVDTVLDEAVLNSAGLVDI